MPRKSRNNAYTVSNQGLNNRSDLELRQVLAMPLLAAVVLLGLHLVNDDLGPPELLKDLSLHLMNKTAGGKVSLVEARLQTNPAGRAHA